MLELLNIYEIGDHSDISLNSKFIMGLFLEEFRDRGHSISIFNCVLAFLTSACVLARATSKTNEFALN